MRTQIEDGGPAFPHTGMSQQGGQAFFQAVFAPGMSLRDWFAGQALAGLLACPTKTHLIGIGNTLDNGHSVVAYGVADCMIAAREGSK